MRFSAYSAARSDETKLTMITRFRIPFIALALAAPLPLAAQDVSGFRLPDPKATPNPDVQGPVDTESGAVPVRPRDLSKPRPTATPAPTPTPVVSPVPTVRPAVQPSATGQSNQAPTTTNRPAPSRSADIQQPVAREPQAQPGATPQTSTEGAGATTGAGSQTPATGTPSILDSMSNVGSNAPEATPESAGDEAGFDWTWPALGLGLLALLGGGFVFWQRRRAAAPPPEIERPVLALHAPMGSGPGALPSVLDLMISAEPIKLTRSIAFATLQYRLTLMNRSAGALNSVDLGADIASAHGAAPMEDQVATSASRLEKRHSFARISPGQTVRYEGTIQIPLSQTRIIRQGKAALFVPLLRVRLDSGQDEPLLKTFVIGQGVPDGGRVTPFRVDEGPRTYSPIAARALD